MNRNQQKTIKSVIHSKHLETKLIVTNMSLDDLFVAMQPSTKTRKKAMSIVKKWKGK